ncbi:MAG TPA: hypothetical protein VIF32_09430 [Gemmatimonadaceae bacterium]|jgi:hypothetical protein
MVSFVEAVFGFAALSFVAAVVFAFQGRRILARRSALLGGCATVIALLLEWYLRPSS